MMKNYSAHSREVTFLIIKEDLKAHFYMVFSHFSCFEHLLKLKRGNFLPLKSHWRVPCTLAITGDVSVETKQKD